jgi:hypothetical protein
VGLLRHRRTLCPAPSRLAARGIGTIAAAGFLVLASAGPAAASGPSFVRAFGNGVNSASGSDICTAASGCKAGSGGGGPAELNYPRGVAASPFGDVYVADPENDRIAEFNSSGSFVRAFGEDVGGSGVDSCTTTCQAGTTGDAAGQLNYPFEVAVSGSGEVYVVDAVNQRIAEFDSSGSFVRAFGKGVNSTDASDVCTAASGCNDGTAGGAAGQLNFPIGVAVSGSGEVYVADASNHRIAEYTASGSFVRAFGKGVNSTNGSDVCTVASGCKTGTAAASAGALAGLAGVAVSGSGEVYVTDASNNRIAEYSASGSFVRAFGKGVGFGADVCTSTCQAGTAGASAGQLNQAAGIAVSGSNEVQVADAANQRIAVFNSSGSFVRAFGKGVNSANGTDVCTAASGCKAGSAGAAASQFSTPGGVAVNGSGEIYVVDRLNHRVDEFSPASAGPPDGDGDGVPDASDNCPLTPNASQVNSDLDNRGGDVCDPDDDNDGLSDAVEAQKGTKRLDQDTDDDGLGDKREVSVTKTKPAKFDSDGDRLSDGLERGVTKPIVDPPGPVVATNKTKFRKDLDPKTKTKPLKKDTDGDKLSDGKEDKNHNGRRDKGETSPLKKDSDGDGFNDGVDKQPLDKTGH